MNATLGFNSSAVLHRSLKSSPLVAVRGSGIYVWSEGGTQYLDAAGSAAVNLIGHGISSIARAVSEQISAIEFVHTSHFTTPVAEDYARELLDFAGEHFRGGRVFFTCGGSEAVETALKLARQYQVEVGHSERWQVISRQQSYHGATLGALAVSGNRRRREIYLPMVRECAHVGLPYCYRCAYECVNCASSYAGEVNRAIQESRGSTAAFIFEPVSGATLGAAVPPNGYLQEVAAICKASDVLLVADEVMTGMGRTGRKFAIDHWNVLPDILVAAKGLSSGYAPLGAVIASAKVVNALFEGSGTFTHGFTYNAHPVSVSAGRAVLKHIQANDLILAADSSIDGSPASRFAFALADLRELPNVGEVRGIGLLRGVEFVSEQSSKRPYDPAINFAGRVANAAAHRGVLVYPVQGCVDGYAGDHILLAPPAIINYEQIRFVVSQLRLAILEAATSL
jgi:adenosylmethionine-8-amino-7-oxononanoate aminotransferase